MKVLRKFAFILVLLTASMTIPVAESQTYVAKIPYFAGTIEIMFPDGGRSVLRTGDRVPEKLPPGTIIRVIDGTLAVKKGNSIDHYDAGQTVRISLED